MCGIGSRHKRKLQDTYVTSRGCIKIIVITHLTVGIYIFSRLSSVRVILKSTNKNGDTYVTLRMCKNNQITDLLIIKTPAIKRVVTLDTYLGSFTCLRIASEVFCFPFTRADVCVFG